MTNFQVGRENRGGAIWGGNHMKNVKGPTMDHLKPRSVPLQSRAGMEGVQMGNGGSMTRNDVRHFRKRRRSAGSGRDERDPLRA
eukprot:765213-Hanusia_phi.AAC.1